ncbi:hypothetical protein L2E82_44718 [Cichorium intybus]|uniref:Uncharacterized protein n=1 Tax=Cichorium intybus TaxID=13427 RepID=A0ACB8ZQ10_CICIN|nr:hypothetical protein L2E82_44718 [Cichorium intybus]
MNRMKGDGNKKVLNTALHLAVSMKRNWSQTDGKLSGICAAAIYASSINAQVTLREEIQSACDYHPFEKYDYIARISNEICCQKLEYVLEKLDAMIETIDEYHPAN